MNNKLIGLQKNHAAGTRQKRKDTLAPQQEKQANLQQAIRNPQAATPADLLNLQSEAGNRAVGNWLSTNGLVQRESLTDANGNLQERLSGAIQRARGGGGLLSDGVRQDMEGAFSTNFGAVRVHTDSEADHLSQQLSARAFTIGSDIFFRRGAYAPGTTRGRRTLQHELTHVVQQGGQAPGGRLRLGGTQTAEEHQAEHNAGANPALSAAATATVQRVLDYDNIAAAFGGSVTAEMVKKWTANVKPKHHPEVEAILAKGKTLQEFQRGMLQVYGVDLAALDADTGVQSQAPQQTSTGSNPPQQPNNTGSSSPAPNNPPTSQSPGVSVGLTGEDLEAYAIERAGKEHMPSGALIDALKDVCGGDLKRLSPPQVDQIINEFKARDFDGLAKRGVSINHIVAFTGGFERLGVGDTKDPNKGISGTLKEGFLGSEARWKESKGAGVADFMQNSWLWSGLTAGGAITSNVSLLNMLTSADNPIIGSGAVNGTELAGNIMMNTASAIQATGSLVRSGADFYNVHQARGFNRNIRGGAIRQQASEGVMNMLYGFSGLTSSGLGFGLGAQNFMAGGAAQNTNGSLGVAQKALEAGTSAVSLGTRIEKSGAAMYRKHKMTGINYRPSIYLSIPGRHKEASVFPKLKAVLQDAQSKKAKGQAVDMGKDTAKTTGGILSSVGYGVGGGAGKYLKLAGALTGLAGTVGSPLINKIKEKVRDKKVEKSGYRNLQEYRMDRMRTLDTTDSDGKKGSVNVRIGQVVDELNEIYEDFHQTNANMKPANLEGPVTQLSVSKLLSFTGEYMQLNTVFSSKNKAERREAIKNVLLARTASF
jgi:hypothetical protein